HVEGASESSVWLGFKNVAIRRPELSTDLGHSGTDVPALTPVFGQPETICSADDAALDAELEIIKAAIDRFEPEVAEAKLGELEIRAPDRLKAHHWYQLKVLRYRILSDRGQWEQAGRMLLDAKRHLPTTERARTNEALGYELVGERDKAHSLA